MKTIVTALLIISALTSATINGATTGFYYTTGPNQPSWVANGSGLIDRENGLWDFNEPQEQGADFEFISYVFSMSTIPDNRQYWDIRIQIPGNSILGEGSFTANRFPFQDDPLAGFSWSGNHRGLNTLTAFFEILEIEYDPFDSSRITTIAFDFIQYEETWDNLDVSFADDRWAYGSYRFNSTMALTTSPRNIPEPSALSLALLGGICALRRRRR